MPAPTPILPPPPVARLVEAARNGLARLSRSSVPAPVAALELIMASWLSQALCVAAKLGLADAVHRGRRSLAELAAESRCHVDALDRLLRALEPHGFFRRAADGCIEQTPLSDCLRADSAFSIRDFALYVGSAAHREHWSELERSIQTGEPSIAPLRGGSFFEYAQRSPEFGTLFDRAMTGLSSLAEEALLTRYDFSKFRSIVDVGGGQGRLLAAILRRAGSVEGVLYDLPEVVAGAASVLERQGVLHRCTVRAGSFLDGVPSGGQAYVLKHILHDWPDAQALQILQHVRGAIDPGGRLVIFESVVENDGAPHIAKLSDLEMLLCLGGRERTRSEFVRLLAESGFELVRVIQTASPISILEARCAARA